MPAKISEISFDIMSTPKQNTFGFYDLDESASQREKDRVKKAQARLAERAIVIPPIKNLRRRRRCQNRPELFCRTYFPEVFYNTFTRDQKKMVAGIVDRIRHGGYQAIAAARGDGKSSIAKFVGGIWATAYGHLKYIVLLGANATFAEAMLKDIKTHIEFSDLMLDDFPEICAPIRALEGAAQRAQSQNFEGVRTRLQWSGKEIVFAQVKGSPAAGAVITTRGIDAAIRGLVRQGRRPDLVIADDIETRESARSQTETEARKATLQQDVLGLAGPGKQMAVTYLCTIIKIGCLADQFSDKTQNPAWHGIRQKLLVRPPNDKEKWDKYIELRQQDQMNGDATGRTALKFYRRHRKVMDQGAKISNPHRFIHKKLPGKKGYLEISPFQHCYNLIADMGWDNFATEYQNAPPADSGPETTGVNVANVCNKINHLDRGLVPPGTKLLTAFIDVGGRLLHWTVVAWRSDMAGAVIDYGTEPVHSPHTGKITAKENVKATQEAILTALIEWRDRQAATGWPETDSDQPRHIDICLVDSGWMPDPVYTFCRSVPADLYRPAKGLGSNQLAGRYRIPAKKGSPRRHGSHWHMTRPSNEAPWLINLDSDYWKNWVHTGMLTPIGQAGAISLFGTEPVKHRTWAEQICAEIWTREFKPGKGWSEGFQVHSKHNHFLDTLAGAAAAAAILGLSALPKTKPADTKKIKLSELQQQKRQKK